MKKMIFTSGTIDYLSKLIKDYPNENMVLMQNEGSYLIAHETEGNVVFKEPRRYEVLMSSGEMAKSGFAIFYHIPVTDEGRPLFEYHFKKNAGIIDKELGFQAIRVLRPFSKDIFVIMTVWKSELDFKAWKNSTSFMDIFSFVTNKKSKKEHKKMFPRPLFITSYYIVEEE